MKKIIITALIVAAVSLSSQAQFKIGILAGVNKTNQRLNITEGSIYAGNNVKSYHAGITGDLALGNNFYLQPQLLFTRKGAYHLSSTGSKDTRVTINYLEVPVNIVYKFDLPFAKLFAGMGAGFSYAISGKEKQGEQKRNLFSNGSAIQREDLSLNFTAGLEFNNGFFASINSQKGLLDISKQGSTSIKNKSFSVSAGYRIDWNRLKRKTQG